MAVLSIAPDHLTPPVAKSMRGVAYALLLLCLCLWSSLAAAHEVRPAVADFTIEDDTLTMTVRLNAEAFLAGVDLSAVEDTNESAKVTEYDQLRALSDTQLQEAFRTAWPTVSRGFNLRASGAELSPQLQEVAVVAEPNSDLPRDTLVTITTSIPPVAETLQIGWAPSYGSLVLRQTGLSESAFTGLVAPGDLSPNIPITGGFQETALENFSRYLVSGFDHIIPKGLDHILFVLGLFFFSTALRPLLIQVTAFTLAHTITLALATLNIVNVPGSIVEPLIAASIVYVAVENIFTRRMTPWRPFVIFGFGLLHGLGFASVLGEFGLDPAHFIASLVAFNIGVEVGQLTVIALAYLAVGYWFGQKDWYRARIAIPASVLIALIGAYWCIERVFF